jgi:hypothetical protein
MSCPLPLTRNSTGGGLMAYLIGVRLQGTLFAQLSMSQAEF